jgi:hypothetical protein
MVSQRRAALPLPYTWLMTMSSAALERLASPLR